MAKVDEEEVGVKLQVHLVFTLLLLLLLLYFYFEKKKRTDPLDEAAIGTDRFYLLTFLSFKCVPVKLKRLG